MSVGITGWGPQAKAPAGTADRGLVYELCQALVGAVLPDYDDYDASLLDSIASHAAQAITRDFKTQGDHKSGCTCPCIVRVWIFIVDHSFRAAQLLSDPH